MWYDDDDVDDDDDDDGGWLVGYCSAISIGLNLMC